jgi:hypothetical protein
MFHGMDTEDITTSWKETVEQLDIETVDLRAGAAHDS